MLQHTRKALIPVIFMTAYASHEFDNLSDLEAVEVMSKPFDTSLLIEKIRMRLE